ncbi:MAG: hypothetical protein AUH71_01415 [Thaumarchaeota archaeon 13_1_40CM_4_48_7]|nr:MAG: hypothetical protein AUH71_01415 [Thaumarchaeota archaeon 13_1_40CM_4_48_7]
MPSEISKILNAYQRTLRETKSRYETLYTSRGKNALDFYRQYANRLIRNYAPAFRDVGARRQLHRDIRRTLGTDTIDFIAIDGSCNKDPFNDFIVFSACAYGAKGQLKLNDSGDRPGIQYRRWELERDVSMVAYVPVPFAQLADAIGEKEDFTLSDQDRINLAGVHTKLMQLAEIYLAYSVVTSSSIEHPRLVLLDLLPSSVMASIAGSPSSINLGGYQYDRRRLDFRDIVVALAHPFNSALGLPNKNRFRLHQLILGELHRSQQKQIDLPEIAKRYGLSLETLIQAANGQPLYGDTSRFIETADGILDTSVSPASLLPRSARVGRLSGHVFSTQFTSDTGQQIIFDVRESWSFTIALFRSICERIFRAKEPDAMIYQVVGSDGKTREHWLDPTDIDFLTAVGMRALIEACWEQKVMLIGIAKDSASRYFTRNYLGVLRCGLQVPELADLEVGRLPWTDRMFFEFVATLEDNLESPWATCEFDSAFMTLWIASFRDSTGMETFKLGAVKDYIVAHTGLFARSLAQFFISRKKATPLMGHVVFVDRLMTPELDSSCPKLDLTSGVLEARGLMSHALGDVRPMGYQNGTEENLGQDMSTYLLSCLTRNHYPEVIGYPDPLHKADWGAKTLGDQLKRTIRSSEVAFRASPLSRTLRSIRDSYRR